jgi:multiple antibiotic resistance protein
MVLANPHPAYAEDGAGWTAPEIAGRKIFFMLFLMLGPIKILQPFVQMTKGANAEFRRQLATRAIVLSAVALGIAGLLGRAMMENFNISLPALSLSGGIVLFLVALQTVLLQFRTSDLPQGRAAPGLHLAFSPLAFPTVVTPYGIAAVIVFASLASGDLSAQLNLAGIVLAILVMDWAAMLFAAGILRWAGTALQVLATVLAITQIALGMQIILQSFSMLGLVERPS